MGVDMLLDVEIMRRKDIQDEILVWLLKVFNEGLDTD